LREANIKKINHINTVILPKLHKELAQKCMFYYLKKIDTTISRRAFSQFNEANDKISNSRETCENSVLQ